ncbi:MAG TPA: hypothetical protein VJK54_02820, partial [Chthoniobacterales bacterium]|nr:hypothetical protein [Chthoniobacterales bacterium]
TSKNQLPLMDDEAILRVWKKADQETLKLQKKEVAALSFKEDWKANNSRWKTYLMAEQLAQEVVTLEEDVARLQEKGLIIKDKNARGKGSDEEVKQACKKVAAAEAKLIAARTEAQKTQAEYDTLASNHQSVMRMNDSEERAVVLQKLKQSDQAVTDLWCALTKSYTKDEIPEPLSLESQQMQQQREVAIYELKRKRDLLHCFEEADQAALAAKQQYKKGDKKGAEALYEDVDQKEIVAWKAYTEAAKNDALESARKRISGMMTFWAERKSNAEAVRKAKELDLSFKKNQKAIGGWADENQRALARLTALAAAEEQAFILYQREEQRLTDIESLWIAIIEAKKEVLRTRAATAAAAFLAGNSMPWSQLSSEERSAYNGEINEINNVYEKSFADEITVAEEEVERVRHKVKKAWLYTDASDNQALESAQMALDNLHAKTRNRQEMRQLGGLTPEKRILKLNEMKQKQVVQKRKPLSPKIEPLQLKTEALQKELRAVRSLEIKKVKDAINDANNSLKYALAVTTKARLQEQGKNNVVELWIEACNNYHLSIEHSIQAANAYVAKKDVRGEEYEKKAKGARDDAWKCYGAAVATTKATGAQEARKESVAALWLQAAQQKRISNEAITAFTQELQKIWDVLYLQHNDLFLKASETENSEIKNRYLKAKIAQEYFSHVVGNYIKEPSEVTLIAIQNAAAIMAVSADRVYGCLPDSSAPGLSYWGLSGIYASIAELKVLDGYSLIQSIGDMIGHPVRYPNMLLTIARVDALSSLTQIANRINRINFSEFDKNENDSDGINYWKKTAELLVEMIKTLNDFAEATGQGFEEGRGSVPLTIIES